MVIYECKALIIRSLITYAHKACLIARIEVEGQLCSAPFYLRRTGEPPVERSLVGVKPSQGCAPFFTSYPKSQVEIQYLSRHQLSKPMAPRVWLRGRTDFIGTVFSVIKGPSDYVNQTGLFDYFVYMRPRARIGCTACA